jgi:hypothetical protein
MPLLFLRQLVIHSAFLALLWMSEYQTGLDFEWLKVILKSNGPVLGNDHNQLPSCCTHTESMRSN